LALVTEESNTQSDTRADSFLVKVFLLNYRKNHLTAVEDHNSVTNTMEAFIAEGSSVPIAACPQDGRAIISFDHGKETRIADQTAIKGTNDRGRVGSGGDSTMGFYLGGKH
jgi:hypothetical protein